MAKDRSFMEWRDDFALIGQMSKKEFESLKKVVENCLLPSTINEYRFYYTTPNNTGYIVGGSIPSSEMEEIEKSLQEEIVRLDSNIVFIVYERSTKDEWYRGILSKDGFEALEIDVAKELYEKAEKKRKQLTKEKK